jgi:hypothetical protein
VNSQPVRHSFSRFEAFDTSAERRRIHSRLKILLKKQES